MVVRTRIRSVLIPLFFYCAAGGASAFLVWGASNGERGLAAKAAYEAQNEELQEELAGLQQERRRWQHRVEAMRSESVDRDLLEEEAHSRLDRVYKDEVVIFTGDKRDAGQKQRRGAVLAQPIELALANINAPTLILAGREDRLIPPAHTLSLAREIVGARTAVVDGVGHVGTVEDPAAVAAEVIAFLQSKKPEHFAEENDHGGGEAGPRHSL